MSEPVSRILARNVLTRFNLILGVLLAVILVLGELPDALFGIVLVTNTLIGVVQELRAKRTLDRLAVATAPTAIVHRDGARLEIPAEELVCDDVFELRPGDAVPVDAAVVASSGLELDESLLTGESAPRAKRSGDEVRSATFVSAGSGVARATEVGPASYARRLSAEARRFGLVRSELRDANDAILRWVSWVMPPAAAILVIGELRADRSLADAATGIVAALVGMVPQGLVLLTSLAFAVAVVALGRRNALVQELPAVEGLARVDRLCLDKTGTITEPELETGPLVPLAEESGGTGGSQAPRRRATAEREARAALGALAAADPAPNRTISALASTFTDPGWGEPAASVPFSSARKYSAASFEGHGTWVLGAPDVLLAEGDPSLARASELAASGLRVVLLASAPGAPPADGDAASVWTPADLRPAALATLRERVRPDASETLAYFRRQGVVLKVFSGDDPATVAEVCRRAGLDPGTPVDARTLPADPTLLGESLDAGTVFGRVGPEQKRDMVRALHARGHVVAMTGDGVNDVLALKEADLGIAMGSGAPAARAVARVVLLDGRFATLPVLLAEGRRVMANVERVARLFVTKTVYAVALALAIGLSAVPFPLLPRQLSVVASLTIGTPAFFLGLAPNAARYRPGFLRRVGRFTLPAGVVAFVAALAAYFGALAAGLPLAQARTVTTVVLTLVGLEVLALVARPLAGWRLGLVAAMAAGLALTLALPPLRAFFELPLPPPAAAAWIVAGAVISGIALWAAVGAEESVPGGS